jgi:hypothetical protein
VAQADGFPHAGAYPTSQWAAGEVVPEVVRLDLAGVPPGIYQVAVGWYDPADPAARLPAQAASGQRLPEDRAVLPDEVTVP